MKQLVQNRINGFRQRHLVSLHKLVYPVLHKTIHPDDAATKHIETDLTNHQIFFFTPTPSPSPRRRPLRPKHEPSLRPRLPPSPSPTRTVRPIYKYIDQSPQTHRPPPSPSLCLRPGRPTEPIRKPRRAPPTSLSKRQPRRRNEAHDDPQTTKLFGRSRKLPGATKYGWTTVCKIGWVGLDNDT